MAAASEPIYGHHIGAQEPAEAYSEAPMDAQHRVAQAGHAAAHHAEAGQQVKSSKSKRVDEANLAKLVAEENASRGKFPRYPGLERWDLIEKMGDGAFSNVYRARDTTGEHNEVAIKVVRKYEMNSMQVSLSTVVFVCVLHLSLLYSRSFIFLFPFTDTGLPLIGKQTFTSGL